MHRHERIVWLLVAFLMAMPVGLARADAVEDALKKVASGDVQTLTDGLTALSSSGSKRALLILTAVQGRDAKANAETGKVIIEVDGKWQDAATGAAVASTDGYESVMVNNVIRRALKPAIAQLSLMDDDPAVRMAAAEEISGTPAPELRAQIVAARKAESQADIATVLDMAIAKIDLRSKDDALQISAIEVVEDRGAIELRGDLERIAADESESDAVRAAAASALSSISTKQFFVRVVGDLFYGISLGSVLMLAALGLAITFGLMGVINMAHGEMLMIGAYTTYAVQSMLDGSELAVVVAIPAAFIVCTLVGVALERTVLRFLYGRPLETLLATWGISLALIQTVRLIFGAQNVSVATPDWLSGGYEILTGVVLPYNRIAIVLFTILVVTALWAILNKTSLGLQVRAVTQNRQMAAAMGIRTHYVDMWTFGLGSGLAGLGGVALSQIGNVGPELGQGYIVDSFMVVVFGGVGKLAGTVVGAMGIGIVNKLLEPISGAVFGKILVLAFIILFIQRRPQGIFAMKGRVLEG